MRCPFLIGPTVYLRPLEMEDARTLQPWINDPEVTRYLLVCHPVSLAWEEEFIRNAGENTTDVTLGIVARAGDRLVGVCGLSKMDLRNRHCMFGIGIGDRSAWNKGCGTEATRLIVGHAFRTLNLHRVWLEVFEYNPRGLRVYEKVGFKTEGRQRQHQYREGRYWDTFVMGMLREDWEEAEARLGPLVP